MESFIFCIIIIVGHGRSEGDRGYIDSIESYVTDVVNHMKETNNEFSQLPLFLMGHSNVSSSIINNYEHNNQFVYYVFKDIK